MVRIGNPQLCSNAFAGQVLLYPKQQRFAADKTTPYPADLSLQHREQADSPVEKALNNENSSSSTDAKSKNKPKRKRFKRIRRLLYGALLFIGLTPGTRDKSNYVHIATQGTPDPAKPVFVIHSGMGDKNNHGGNNIRETLQHFAREGRFNIHPGNIVVLDNVYPSLYELVGFSPKKLPQVVYNGWTEGISEVLQGNLPETPILFKFAKSLWMYFDSNNPNSSIARTQHEQLTTVLKSQGLQDSDIILIGHSAGGPMMLAICERDSQYAEKPLNIKAVITLGSPLVNPGSCPKTDAQVVRVVSKKDEILNLIEETQNFIGIYPTRRLPSHPNADEMQINQEYASHMSYTWDYRLLEFILKALNSEEVKSLANATVIRTPSIFRLASHQATDTNTSPLPPHETVSAHIHNPAPHPADSSCEELRKDVPPLPDNQLAEPFVTVASGRLFNSLGPMATLQLSELMKIVSAPVQRKIPRPNHKLNFTPIGPANVSRRVGFEKKEKEDKVV